MRLYALNNADAVAARIMRRADGLKLAGAAATAVLTKEVLRLVDPLLRAEAPVRSGALRDQMRVKAMRVPGGALLVWSDDVPYLPYVVEGTGVYHRPDPHSAWDVQGPQSFTVGGARVFARATHHLGQHPDDFAQRALGAARPAIAAALFATGHKILVGFRA